MATPPFFELASTALLEAVLSGIPVPLVIFDTQRRYIYCNRWAIQNPEIREWIIGHNDLEYCLYRGFDLALGYRRNQQFDQAIATRATVSFEETFDTPQGQLRQLRYITPLYSPAGELEYFLGYGLDITALRAAQDELELLNEQLESRVQELTAELKEVTERLQHDTLHDALTGLPNRVLFSRSLATVLGKTTNSSVDDGAKTVRYALFFVDADHFKSVNEALSHPVGDQLLIELARRLEQVVALLGAEATDVEAPLARLDGDEFGVLFLIQSEQQALAFADKLLQQIARPFIIEDHELLISASLGVVFIGPEYQQAIEVMRDADIALYRAKTSERGGYQVFTPQMRQEALQLIDTEKELRLALKRGELLPYFQPIVNLDTMQISGFEALARWQHPTRGLLTPYHFMAVAEDSGLVAELDRWILRAAVTEFASWLAYHPSAHPLSLSVNVSGRHFVRRNILPELSKVVTDFDLRPGQLCLELTESVFLDHPQCIGHVLRQIRGLGVDLHIDDFGTGYSSLSYLQTYPLSNLKIDRSFVQHITDQSSSAELVKTITNMAKNLHMTVTAEGIETPEQLAALRDLQCDYAQGYYFARPLPAAEAYAFWQQQQGEVTSAVQP